MTDWFDPLVLCNIGLVLATVGLMIATLVYTLVTKKMSIETEKSRKTQERQYELDAMPNIRIKTEWFGVHLICYIINVGRCPALDLQTEISVKLREESALKGISPCNVHSKLLLTNETIRFMVPHHQLDQIKKNYRSLKIVGKCKDIYNNEHEFVDELEFNLPDGSTNDEEHIRELIPDDDPLIKALLQNSTRHFANAK